MYNIRSMRTLSYSIRKPNQVFALKSNVIGGIPLIYLFPSFHSLDVSTPPHTPPFSSLSITSSLTYPFPPLPLCPSITLNYSNMIYTLN